MQNLSRRVAGAVVYGCIVSVIATTGIGIAGIVAVRSATTTAVRLSAGSSATTAATASLGQAVGAAYSTGQALATRPDPKLRDQRVETLTNTQLPAVETELATLRRLHGDDHPADPAGMSTLVDEWTAVRALLNSATTSSATAPDADRASALETAFAPLNAHINELIARSGRDSAEQRAAADAAGDRSVRQLVGAMGLTVLVVIGLGVLGNRRMQGAIEPSTERAEFTDALALAEDEGEAQRLLQRHLERLVDRSLVTVLNANADARPGSCLAVRSASIHDEDDEHRTLSSCPVCGDCPGRSLCTPLMVAGTVIGSVLVNRPQQITGLQRQRIHEAVGQAAPVLANLHNLAIAELRASTDPLTGLPNKRAVGDTLGRMLAQASRTFTPMSLLVLDIDHLKEVNDRFGHRVGDQALANVGAAIRSAIRDSDFAGRVGGAEFAVLLPDTALDGALLAADKLRAAIAGVVLIGVDVAMTASIGIAAYPDHATDTAGLERLADSALYAAKHRGRDRIEIAVPTEEPLTRP